RESGFSLAGRRRRCIRRRRRSGSGTASRPSRFRVRRWTTGPGSSSTWTASPSRCSPRCTQRTARRCAEPTSPRFRRDCLRAGTTSRGAGSTAGGSFSRVEQQFSSSSLERFLSAAAEPPFDDAPTTQPAQEARFVMKIDRKVIVGAVLACIVLVATATVGAANVTGTNGDDTLRGGASADTLVGTGGNAYGAGGNDVLSGGGGNDLLVGGRGADKLTCGPGQDIARGDAQDKIGADCEIVKGVASPSPAPAPAPQPPPAPAPPAASPVTA